MRRRRITRLATLSFVLGFITTWAVAWGVAYARPKMGYDGSSSFFESRSSPSVECRYYAAVPRSTAGHDHDLWIALGLWYSKYHADERWGLEDINWVNKLCERVGTGEVPVTVYSQYDEFAVGWPRLSAWAWRVGPNKTQGAIEYGKHGFDAGRLPFRALPYLPIYRGIIINTVFYALLWLPVLFLSTHTIRALRRRACTRRGRCPNCNYDLAGLVSPHCPECGIAPSPPKIAG